MVEFPKEPIKLGATMQKGEIKRKSQYNNSGYSFKMLASVHTQGQRPVGNHRCWEQEPDIILLTTTDQDERVEAIVHHLKRWELNADLL